MRQALGALVRLVVVLGVGLTLAALVLGRDAELRGERGGGRRSGAPPRYQPLNDSLFPESRAALRVLDLEQGIVRLVPLADGGWLGQGACSPWRNEQGEMQVVGVWKSPGRGGARKVGLARYALPSGTVVDCLDPLDSPPGSPPCWHPDGTLRIVFAGQDGRLYRCSFDSAGETGRREPVVRRLAWLNPPHRAAPTFIGPTWPTDPRLRGCLIASLTFPSREALERGEPHTQLWWLRLTADGSAIAAGGRLIDSGRAAGALESWPPGMVREEHLASVAAAADGRLVLACLVRRGNSGDLDLTLAPLEIERSSGTPRVDAASVVTVARGRGFAPPAFSIDRRWVYSLSAWPPGPVVVDRSDVLRALSRKTSDDSAEGAGTGG